MLLAALATHAAAVRVATIGATKRVQVLLKLHAIVVRTAEDNHAFHRKRIYQPNKSLRFEHLDARARGALRSGIHAAAVHAVCWNACVVSLRDQGRHLSIVLRTAGVHIYDTVNDGGRQRAGTLEVNPRRERAPPFDHGAHLRIMQSRRKEEKLRAAAKVATRVAWRPPREDLLGRGQVPFVHKPICFVEDEKQAAIERQTSLFEQIKHTSRRSTCEQRATLAKHAKLRIWIRTAD